MIIVITVLLMIFTIAIDHHDYYDHSYYYDHCDYYDYCDYLVC